ncbi:Hypothetical predicted protein [Mytilus galloprovincialis]|uniref:Uncharacterized protein n=1 Tax=Mytilus galloprovincialis TaxID=29158 RepID=A0A8B6HDN0_MYTGA|nr:Hypothetical predicted protein [Mytilus galloprovincialis]
MKIGKILCAMFMMLMSVLAGAASGHQPGLPPPGLEFHRGKRDANANNIDRMLKRG